MFKIVLFDLDGTLTNPKEGITKSVQYALKDAGIIENDLKKLIGFIGPPLQKEFEIRYGFSEEQSKRALQKYRERFSVTGLFENEVINGIPDLLKKLKERNIKLAVATSKPEVYTLRILEKFDLLKYFDCVTGSELDGRRIDKKEVIEEVFSRLRLSEKNKKSAIMVGDRSHDIIGAKKNGIKSIGVKFGFAKENELEDAGADYIVDTVDEIYKIIIEN